MDLPKIIYKYRDWKDKYHRKILTEHQVWLASPKSFNDPFDCRIITDYRNMSKDEILEYINRIMDKHGSYLENEGFNLDATRKQYYKELISNPVDFALNSYDKNYNEAYDDYLGILCLSTNWNNLLLWSHYSNNHSGFVIGFDSQKLINSYKFSSGGFVQYPDSHEHPKVKPSEEREYQSFMTKIFTKAYDWNYEEEYRLTKFNFPNKFNSDTRSINIDVEAITEINFGLNTSEPDKQEILKEIDKLNHVVDIYQINRVPYKYQLKREKIN